MPEPLADDRQHDADAAGVSMSLDAAALIACAAAAERVREQVFDLLVQGWPVAVSVVQLESAGSCESSFKRVCEELRQAAERARCDPGLISIVVGAGSIAPKPAWSSRLRHLGRGPVYLQLSAPMMQTEQDEFWSQCWRLRGVADLRLLLAPMVGSPCPLLSPEAARGVLPGTGLQVPVGSAWIALQIDLAAFANDAGEIDVDALHAHARHCVEQGESMHNITAWPNAALRHDAWFNRRLAIELRGIGELVALRGFDPARFESLQALDAILCELRGEIVAHSKTLAASAGRLPALEAANPFHGPANPVIQFHWQQCWRNAVEAAAIRHRNLVAMSPWSLFPGGNTADRRYVDLLPLLRHADLVAFPRPPSLHSWNMNEFKYFHGCAGAVLQRKHARQLIAEQV